MGNLLTIDRIAFQHLNASGEIVGMTYRFRCSDDYGSEYIDAIEGLTSLLRMKPRDLIKMAGSLNENASVMIAHAISHNQPILIDDELVSVATIDFDRPSGSPDGQA